MTDVRLKHEYHFSICSDGRLRRKRNYGTGRYYIGEFMVWREEDQWRIKLDPSVIFFVQTKGMIAFEESGMEEARFRYRREAVDALSALIATAE